MYPPFIYMDNISTGKFLGAIRILTSTVCDGNIATSVYGRSLGLLVSTD